MSEKTPVRLTEKDIRAIEAALHRNRGHAEVFVGKDGAVRVYHVRRDLVQEESKR